MDFKRFGTVACTALLKTLLMIFNILFIALGLALLVIGAYGIKSFKYFFTFAPSQQIYVPVICIGLFMMIVGVLALWCVPKGVNSLLILYSIIIFILFLSIFTISIIFMVQREKFETTIKTGIANAIKNFPEEATSVDLLQENIKCCGVENYTDWFETKWADGKKKVPKSCCKVNENTCRNEDLSPKKLHWHLPRRMLQESVWFDWVKIWPHWWCWIRLSSFYPLWLIANMLTCS